MRLMNTGLWLTPLLFLAAPPVHAQDGVTKVQYYSSGRTAYEQGRQDQAIHDRMVRERHREAWRREHYTSRNYSYGYNAPYRGY
jgi:hypothetical protein